MTNYIVKKYKKGIFLCIEVWKKEWSDRMYANTVIIVSRKKFILNTPINTYWISKKIFDDLYTNKEIEVIKNNVKTL